jgi:hypothetical protein
MNARWAELLAVRGLQGVNNEYPIVPERSRRARKGRRPEAPLIENLRRLAEELFDVLARRVGQLE